MTPLSGKALAKVVSRHGWVLLRVNGSHHVYGKLGSMVKLSIPIHGSHPLKKGLFRHLVKQAGLLDADLR